MATLAREISDQRVLEAIEQTPRERFVRSGQGKLAYRNTALPIEDGQTMSQPSIVAVMTEALALKGDETVLEVGTGSGYQAAILSRLAKEIITVERIPALAASAGQRLEALHCDNVRLVPAGATLGYAGGAPYDAILVTAGAPEVPDSLVEQLKQGGRLVIPVGDMALQELILGVRHGDNLETVSLGGCRFVPLISLEAWGRHN